MLRSYITILCFALALTQFACFSEDDSSSSGTYERSNPEPEVEAPAPDTVEPPPQFTTVGIKNFKAFKKLRDSIGEARTDIILKLNRRDSRNIRKNDSLIIPAIYDESSLSPFPHVIESIRDIPKLILISRRVQALAAYEYGVLVRWAPTSTGKQSTPTPAGLHQANWREHNRISSIDSSWILPWCVNITRSGVAIHAYSVPGYPASHACVRVPSDDAKWIFHWVDLRSKGKYGTPVIVFDEYAYGQRPPWRRLPEDPNADKVTTAELDALIATYRPTLNERMGIGTAADSTIAAHL